MTISYQDVTLQIAPVSQQEACRRHRAGRVMARAATDKQRARVFVWWCQRYGVSTARQYLLLWRHGEL